MLSKLALNPQTFLYSVIIALTIGLSSGIAGTWYLRGLQISAIKASYAAENAKMETKVAVAKGETTKARLEFQASMGNYKNELDQVYTARVSSLNSTVNKLSGIRLRDPTTDRNPGTTGNAGNTEGDNRLNAESTGLLSTQTSQHLWNFAGEAQGYLDRLEQCKLWNAQLKTEYDKYRIEILELQRNN